MNIDSVYFIHNFINIIYNIYCYYKLYNITKFYMYINKILIICIQIFVILRIPDYSFRLFFLKKKECIHLWSQASQHGAYLQTYVVTQKPETKSEGLNLVCVLKVHLISSNRVSISTKHAQDKNLFPTGSQSVGEEGISS